MEDKITIIDDEVVSEIKEYQGEVNLVDLRYLKKKMLIIELLP